MAEAAPRVSHSLGTQLVSRAGVLRLFSGVALHKEACVRSYVAALRGLGSHVVSAALPRLEPPGSAKLPGRLRRCLA